MIINNKTEAVIVLKAVGLPNLRLFPGYNTVEEKGLEKYFTGVAAKAHQKKNLSVVKSDEVTTEEKKLADRAKVKNAKLNKAQRVVKAQNETLVKNDKTISDQAKLISDQGTAIEDLMVKLEKVEAMLTDPDKEPEPVKPKKKAAKK